MNTQKLYRYVRQACDNYRLIEENDHIALGLSGGKDSLVLLYALAGMRRFYPYKFELSAITIDLGFGMDYSPVEKLCRELDVPYIIEKTQISRVVFEETKTKNPCSLCANMRRGALVNAADREHCTKIALGHHNEDIIHTMMMSMLFQGRFYSVSPYTDYPDRNIGLIRPLIYVREGEIKSFAEKNSLPVIKNACPMDKHSAREDMKQLLDSLTEYCPEAKTRLFHAVETGNIDDWLNAAARKEK